MKIKLDEKGLVPTIAQDAKTGKVLMLGYMNSGSLKRTLASGEAWFYSRSRQELWHKGEVSGNFIKVKSVQADCDGDTLLLNSEPTGPVCHTGNPTCFYQDVNAEQIEFERPSAPVLDELFSIIEERKRTKPQDSYVAKLLASGVERPAKKVVEEAGETAIAAMKGAKDELVRETADLWFHSLVLLSAAGLTPQDVFDELKKRRK